MYGQNLNFKAHEAAEHSRKLIEENGSLQHARVGAEAFNKEFMESKLESDATFLFGLGKSLNESDMTSFTESLEMLLENTNKLFKEVDMKPRTCSGAIDNQELNESTVQEIYAKNLTSNMTAEFTQPLFEGTLLEDNKENSKLLMESIIKSGMAKEVDAELFLKYALFENSLVANIRKIALPEVLEERTKTYIGVQDHSYFELFDENAQTLLDNIEESSLQLGSVIAPHLFIKGLQESSTQLADVQAYAGASKLLR